MTSPGKGRSDFQLVFAGSDRLFVCNQSIAWSVWDTWSGRKPSRVPTDGSKVAAQIADHLSRVQVETLERNCAEFGVPIYSIGSEHQGIVHVIGPELGLTQPGMTIVCGDSHTSTHGAFGSLAFGIGTSEVEHVLATECLA